MHQSALNYGRLFFGSYIYGTSSASINIVEIGSLNVNGSLRDVCPSRGVNYIGLDFSEGAGVDIVIEDPYKLPIEDSSVDIVVSSSCFEHSEFFWLVFLEVMRVLKDDGVFYLNAPSNGIFHRYPVDCWRFYPDSGVSLVNWAKRNGYSPILSESFIGEKSADGIWHDYIAIFIKNAQHLAKYPRRVIHSLSKFYEGYVDGCRLSDTEISYNPDFIFLEESKSRIANLNRTVTERDNQIANLNQTVTERDNQIANLNQTVTERDNKIANLNRTVADRDNKIANLNRTVADRDNQFTNLNQAAADHNNQVASLSYVISERDNQIANLKQVVVERDSQINFQKERIEVLLQSRSWRITGSLRFISGKVNVGIRLVQATFNRASVRIPMIRQLKIRRIRLSPLFDQTFYAEHNPDIRIARLDPATHYYLSGWKEYRDPSARFSTRRYLEFHPDVATADINPLLHYIEHGQAEGRQIQGVEDGIQKRHQTGSALILNDDTPVDSSSCSVHGDIIRDPMGISPTDQPDLDHERIDAEVEVIRKSGLFDAAYYIAMYPDIQPPPAEPIRHYCEYGWREGRNPSDDFDTLGYLEAYSDIRNAGLNPFWHYVIAGASEGRKAAPDSGSQYEDDIYFGKIISDVLLIAHYTTPDWNAMQEARKMTKKATTGQLSIPHEDLGFYHIFEHSILSKQAAMARRHGISAWCFTLDMTKNLREEDLLHYFLASRDIDIGFCLNIVLNYSRSDEQSIAYLESVLTDERYLRIDKRPVVLMTLPDNDHGYIEALQAINNIFYTRFQRPLHPYRIVRCNNLNVLPRCEFEAILDLPIDSLSLEAYALQPRSGNTVNTIPYGVVVSQAIARRRVINTDIPIYKTIALGRDDPPLEGGIPFQYTGFHLKEYRRWLDAAISESREKHAQGRRLLFLSAWNKWDHGAVLEPDRLSGYSRLNETSRALLGLPYGQPLPKVSVIVPNYNHALYLHHRLESIYRQTYPNIEVLLLDDCSTDQSRELLLEYAERYPEITATLFNEKNSGNVFRQWAKGIKIASGDLIWIAESDDYCDENFLEKLVRYFKDEAVMLAYSKIEFVRADESRMQGEFWHHVRELSCREKWKQSYINTAHREISEALGIINTIPNASGALFRRPVNMSLLEEERWLSMRIAGDWIFYLYLIRGGKIAYCIETTNYFRRYKSSAAANTYDKKVFYEELSATAQAVIALYDVSDSVINQFGKRVKQHYDFHGSESGEEFSDLFDEKEVGEARHFRTPNIAISTMGFYPGGAEIFPIRLANEFKQQGYSVTLISTGHGRNESGVRRMLRNDIAVVEAIDIEATKLTIQEFGIEVLNSHQWHVQKYPIQVPDVFCDLKAHIASLHGMIEYGEAFGVTAEQLRVADENVAIWVYTADKNLGPFIEHHIYEQDSFRFTKLPNGMEPPKIKAIAREELGISEDAFVLCCVSRAVPDKGWAEAIEAVSQARELSKRNICLILVGNGLVYDEYCRSGVPEFVYLIGFSENSVGYYATADMGIMLTKFRSESFPLTIVDCLFAGRPYISSDVGEIKNMLTEEGIVAGAVIPLHDWQVPIDQVAAIIVEFSKKAERYSEAISLVPELAARYRIDNIVRRYAKVFQDALARREQELTDNPHSALIWKSSQKICEVR